MAPRGWKIIGMVGLLLLVGSAPVPAPIGGVIHGQSEGPRKMVDVQSSRQQVQHRLPLPASGDQLHRDLVRLRQDRAQLRFDLRSGADHRTIQADKEAIRMSLGKVRQDMNAIRRQPAGLRAEPVGMRSDARERQAARHEFRLER
jgi:hypothetical protein